MVEKSQAFASSAGRFLAPPTERKIHRRNCTYRVLASRALNGLIGWLSTRHARTETLADCAGRPADGFAMHWIRCDRGPSMSFGPRMV